MRVVNSILGRSANTVNVTSNLSTLETDVLLDEVATIFSVDDQHFKQRTEIFAHYLICDYSESPRSLYPWRTHRAIC